MMYNDDRVADFADFCFTVKIVKVVFMGINTTKRRNNRNVIVLQNPELTTDCNVKICSSSCHQSFTLTTSDNILFLLNGKQAVIQIFKEACKLEGIIYILISVIPTISGKANCSALHPGWPTCQTLSFKCIVNVFVIYLHDLHLLSFVKLTTIIRSNFFLDKIICIMKKINHPLPWIKDVKNVI